jgi:hypothetical protein
MIRRRLLPFLLSTALCSSPAFAFTAGEITTYSDTTGAHIEASGVHITNATIHAGNATGWVETQSPASSAVSQIVGITNPGQAIIGVLGAARTSDLQTDPGDTFGVVGIGSSDITGSTSQRSSWALYTEGWRYHGTTSQFTLNSELDEINLDAVVDINPYVMTPNGFTPDLWLSCGKPGIPGSPTQFNCSTAIGIINNSKPFEQGIVFGANSLNGDDGVTGTAPAIVLAKGHLIVWTSEASLSSGPLITSLVDSGTPAASMQMVFNNGTVNFNTSGGGEAFQINGEAGSTSQVIVFPSTTDGPGFTTDAGSLVLTSNTGNVIVSNLAGSGSRPVCITSTGILEAGSLSSGLVTCP